MTCSPCLRSGDRDFSPRSGWSSGVAGFYKAFVPFFKTLATVFLQLFVGGKKILGGFLYGFVKFAIIIVVFAAHHRPLLIDLACAALTEVSAGAVHVQEPAIGILEDIDVFV